MAKFAKHTACGFLMQKELDHLALDACARPLAAIVGGAKVSTKLPVIQSLMAKWCVRGREARGHALIILCVYTYIM